MGTMVMPSRALPARACLLCGGESRRMGRDKALLPHPEGGTWLERILRRLAELEVPITVLSRHPRHLELAAQLAAEWGRGQGRRPGPPLTTIAEPAPREGPLLALHRLMPRHPDQRLLLCPVDMPALHPGVLRQLLAAATDPKAIHLAHDGERLQPLPGVYPSDAARRASLAAAIASGERRLQDWLAGQPCRMVRLDSGALRNINRPEEI